MNENITCTSSSKGSELLIKGNKQIQLSVKFVSANKYLI